jgi:hypothetical protein
MSVFGRNCRFEQLFSLLKNIKSINTTRLTDEHLEGRMRIATTEVKPDIESLTKPKQYKISQQWLILLKKITE